MGSEAGSREALGSLASSGCSSLEVLRRRCRAVRPPGSPSRSSVSCSIATNATWCSDPVPATAAGNDCKLLTTWLLKTTVAWAHHGLPSCQAWWPVSSSSHLPRQYVISLGVVASMGRPAGPQFPGWMAPCWLTGSRLDFAAAHSLHYTCLSEV